MTTIGTAITTTFRIDPRYIESTPYREDWEDIGITKVELERQKLITSPDEWGNTITSEMAFNGAARLSYYELELDLESNSTYRVRTIVTNSQGETTSLWQEFSTSDTDTYYNIETTIIDSVTGDPIEEATITIDSGGTEEQISRASEEDGLVWIQRILDGEYDLLIAAAGYTSRTISGIDVSSTDWQPGVASTLELTPVT